MNPTDHDIHDCRNHLYTLGLYRRLFLLHCRVYTDIRVIIVPYNHEMEQIFCSSIHEKMIINEMIHSEATMNDVYDARIFIHA